MIASNVADDLQGRALVQEQVGERLRIVSKLRRHFQNDVGKVARLANPGDRTLPVPIVKEVIDAGDGSAGVRGASAVYIDGRPEPEGFVVPYNVGGLRQGFDAR